VAGRCGAGAVLGAKKIKALVAYGTQRPEIYNRKGFNKYVKKWVAFLRNHPMTGEALPNYGSAGLVSKANSTNALPTHNFKYGHTPDAHYVSGDNADGSVSVAQQFLHLLPHSLRTARFH
jgi:aldehyde:ferredoxin oxidoreductase